MDAAREKLFEVREIENDASLLRNYLTRELCDDLDLYIYGQQGDDVVVTEKDWEKVRDTLVTELTAHGRPLIVADDGDYRGNRELYLRHSWEGRDLDLGLRREGARIRRHALGPHRPSGNPQRRQSVRPLVGCPGRSQQKDVIR